jgi:hypothetical protein
MQRAADIYRTLLIEPTPRAAAVASSLANAIPY